MSADKYPSIFSRQMKAQYCFFIAISALRASLAIYLVNKPLRAAGMWADNVRG